jgi:hypothetical protein
MISPRKSLMGVLLAVFVGGGLFAIGYSMRLHNTSGFIPAPPAVSRPALALASVSGIAALPRPVSASQDGVKLDETDSHTGVVLLMNGELYILRVDDSDTWNHLDDQKMASKFLGKRVTVTGEVDPFTSVIHVTGISETTNTSA